MTAKPTARERFEDIKAGSYDGVHGGPLTKDFLISLVEAAVEYAGEEIYTKYVNFKDEKAAQDFVWEVLSKRHDDQRMAEGEGKV